ncbi:MAG: hypothetical protein MUF04_14990, partial [Akkermansiaceae bacterium]|nr:hypothetical protein [Akkermansiaceae bacterium]
MTSRSISAALFACTFAAWVPAGTTRADEPRVWTTRQITSLTATLGKVGGSEVTLVSPEKKEARVKLADLSLADREHLVAGGAADDQVLALAPVGVPEKECRMDSRSFKALPDKLALGRDSSDGLFSQLQSEHFLVAHAGRVRPQVVAEIAERLWHGMAFQHSHFRRDWGARRRLIILCADDDAYAALGRWYFAHLESGAVSHQDHERVRGEKVSWEVAAGRSISLPADLCQKENLHPEATVFNAKDREYRKVFEAFPTNTLAGDLLRQQTGNRVLPGPRGRFAITTGHAFFKEILLAGKTETHLLDTEGSLNELVTKAGFEDGTGWARLLKAGVKRGTIKPDFAALLEMELDSLTPEGLVLMYSLAYYCHSTPARLLAYARLVARLEDGKAV